MLRFADKRVLLDAQLPLLPSEFKKLVEKLCQGVRDKLQNEFVFYFA